MCPAYRYGEPCPYPYPPYYWDQSNVARPRPIPTTMPEPYYYYKEPPENYYRPPHEWSFNCGGDPYWHCPEYEFYRPKFTNYEGDGRDFRPHTYIPPPSPYAYTRPFNPSEQFRHPDDYPMRYVPATGYDRFGPYPLQQHCCGCPNHVFQPKPVEMTIEEPADAKRIKNSEEIDGKQMMDDSGKTRLENLQKLPEPIMWIPGSLSERDEEKYPVYWVPWNRKSIEGGRGRPCPGYWVPLDSYTGRHDKKSEDENGKLPPFPIFWIPTKFSGEGDSKVENPPQETKRTDGGEAEKANEGVYAKPAEQKKGKAAAREIPVKQLEEEGKPSQTQKTEERVSKVPENHNVKKASSPRASKLPPVCLRVDPLPRKKLNGTSSSRSPSPPRKDEESKDKVAVKAEENANSSASKVDIETKKAEQQQSNMQIKEAKVKENAQVSRDQAALKIQALYRGYQVRKFQSLKKLREIMKVRGRVEQLRQQMSSTAFVGELSRDSKARWRFNENLMGLLLQLDTIQGLHPVVRDVRKSVARDLTTLQEKLDTLVEQACANKTAAAEKMKEPITTLEVTEISGDTLLKTSCDNQQIGSDKAGIGENVENTGSIMEEVLEVENKANKDGEAVQENAEEIAPDKQDVLQVENEAIEDGDDLQEKAPIKQEGCLYANTKDGQYEEEKAEIVNQDNEKDSMILPAEVTSDNITAEERNGSGFSNVRSDIEKLLDSALLKEEDVIDEKLSSATLGKEHGIVDNENEKLLDPAMPGEEDIINEKLASAPLEEEQAIVDIKNEKLLNSTLPKENIVNEGLSSVTLEQEQAVVDIENEKLLDLALPKQEDVINEKISLVSLEQEQAIEDMENVNALDEKPAMGSQDNSIVTAPEAEIDQEKIAEKCTAPVSVKNEDERDKSRALTEETEQCHDNDKMEFNLEVPSGTISHAIEEKILARMEETLPSNENMEAATTETHGIGKPVETVITLEADLNAQTALDLAAKEELLLPALKQPAEGKESTFRRGEILQVTECGMADMEDKLTIESKSIAENKFEDAYVVNINDSESKILQCEGKQDHEKWEEENEKLKKMVEKLMAAGKLQMSTIGKLNDKIMQLEDKLSQGKARKRKIRGGPPKLKSNVATNKRNSTALGT